MRKSTQIIIAQQGKASNLTAAILSLLLIGNLAQASPSTINEPLLGQVHQEYGESAQTRLRQWQQIVNYAIGKPEIEQLALANNFINQAQFIDSPYYQDGFDFRLSPMAFLILGAGDSEEFSIAKYFTLREMGIHSNKLRLTYTEIQANNASHMVLAYYGADDAEPLVLDYLDKTVRPMSQRQDIRPIYSFDADHIWLIQSNAKIQLDRQLARPMDSHEKPLTILFKPVATHY